MGNCLRRDKNLARTMPDEPEPKPDPPKFHEENEARGKEETSFKAESKVVRIKVVVTREELRQILGHKKGIDSVEDLVRALKRRPRKISRVHDGEIATTNWRPTLESIPEDCC